MRYYLPWLSAGLDGTFPTRRNSSWLGWLYLLYEHEISDATGFYVRTVCRILKLYRETGSVLGRLLQFDRTHVLQTSVVLFFTDENPVQNIECQQ